jgi:FkbM family methyltransferase
MVLFEANPAHLRKLRASGFDVHIALLGDENRTVDYFETGGTGDSIFREKSGLYDRVAPGVCRMQMLDDLVVESSLPSPNLLKIDTQGSELLILKGAEVTISKTEVIYLEMPVMSYNEGAPTWDAVMQHLISRGFVPIAVLEKHTLRGALVQMDMLFMSSSMFSRVFGATSLEFVSAFTAP